MKLHPSYNVIINDNTSGSGEILHRLTEVMKTNIKKKRVNPKDLQQDVTTLKKHLQHFPVILHFLDFICGNTKQTDDLLTAIEDYNHKWTAYHKRLIKKACGIAKDADAVMVHSNSSMVTRFLLQLKKEIPHLKIFQTESRPAMEGRNQAKTFLSNDIDVHFLTDANVGMVMPQTKLVVLGADILTEKTFVNKSGSSLLCLAARHLAVPVMLITDPRKKSTRGAFEKADFQKSYPASEVWDFQHHKLTILNQYFEDVPLGLVNYKVI